MRCEQARQLFDAYLNGELAGALATELGAHRLQCAQCRRELALLEVSCQIIASDRDSVSLRADFVDRLLACMQAQPARRFRRFRRRLYVAGPLAAAAVVLLGFLGIFSGRDTKVAGEKSVLIDRTNLESVREPAALPVEEVRWEPGAQGGYRDEHVLEQWLERARKNIEAKRESGESLQKYLDLTILQWIDILDNAKDSPPSEDHLPGAEVTSPLTAPEPAPRERDHNDQR